MKNLLYCMLAFAIILTQACKKKKDNDQPENQSPPPSNPTTVNESYSQLKTGNYWIYQKFSVDTSGNETPIAGIDSCYVTGDTTIHGNTFHIYRSPNVIMQTCIACLRDSADCIINSAGQVIFSSTDFTSVFYNFNLVNSPGDTVYKVTAKMADKDLVVTTTAGTFTTSAMQRKYVIYPNYANGYNPRYQNSRYAKNIGLITETLPSFLTQVTRTERRLIRYHLN